MLRSTICNGPGYSLMNNPMCWSAPRSSWDAIAAKNLRSFVSRANDVIVDISIAKKSPVCPDLTARRHRLHAVGQWRVVRDPRYGITIIVSCMVGLRAARKCQSLLVHVHRNLVPIWAGLREDMRIGRGMGQRRDQKYGDRPTARKDGSRFHNHCRLLFVPAGRAARVPPESIRLKSRESRGS